MVFTTQIFIFAFFPLCVVAYLLADRVEKIGRFGVWLKKLRAKDVLLIAFSLVFYMWPALMMYLSSYFIFCLSIFWLAG